MKFIRKTSETSELEKPLDVVTFDQVLCSLREKDEIEDTVYLWKAPKGLYLTEESSINYVNQDYAKELGYDIVRVDECKTGPATVILGGGLYCLTVFIKGSTDDVDLYGRKMWQHFAGLVGLKLELKNNDLVAEGTDRKVGSFVVKTTSPKIYSILSIFSGEIDPDIDLNKLFLTPSNKFEGKNVINPAERISSLKKEFGHSLSPLGVEKEIIKYFKNLGISLEKVDDFTQEEKDLAKSLESKYSDLEWIKYGKKTTKPDFI